MKEVVIADDGTLPVTLKGVKREVDLYATYNSFSTMHAQVANDLAAEPDSKKEWEYHERLCAFINESLGFPRPSHREAASLEAAIFAAVGEVGKDPAAPQTPA